MSNYPNNHVYESNCLNCQDDLYSNTDYKDFCDDTCKYEHLNHIQRLEAEAKKRKEEEEKKSKEKKSYKKES